MTEPLLVVIYALLIIFITIAIMIGIKLLGTLNKVNDLLDDVNGKVKSLDRVFEVIDTMNDKIALVGDTVVGFVSGGLRRFFKETRRSKKIKEESEEDEDE